MPGYCTCGAKLPEDARFCHKCGKPQREEDLLAEKALAEQAFGGPARAEQGSVAQAPEPVLEPVRPAPRIPPIGFHNRAAVNAALLAGIAGFLLAVLSGRLLPAAFVLGLIAAGFLSVYLYQRRTGEKLSVLHGAHLGWISGVFGFAIMAVILALLVVILSDQSVVESMRQQLQGTSAGQQAQIEQMIQMIHNPPVLLTGLVVIFFFFTVFPAFGGALGAKFLDRRS